MRESQAARPSSVTAAAALFVVYGIAMVVIAGVTQDWSGWIEAGSLPRAILRLAAAVVIAWGLLRGASWAWWVGVALATLWLVSGLAPVLVMERGDIQWLPPSGYQIFLAIGLVGLAVALVLLVTPSARQYLRPARRE